jgi:hypothetical protein
MLLLDEVVQTTRTKTRRFPNGTDRIILTRNGNILLLELQKFPQGIFLLPRNQVTHHRDENIPAHEESISLHRQE